jgi:hypothetical protein
MPSEEINMLTHIQATCLQWPPMSTVYVIRVDLTDTSTGIILSTSTYQVGYAQTDIDTVLVNPATAPAYSGVWSLEVDFYIFQGGQILVHGTSFGIIQVGNTITLTHQTTTAITAPVTEMTRIQQSTTTTQSLNATVRKGFGPSTQQLEYTLIVLIMLLILVSLAVIIKLKQGKPDSMDGNKGERASKVSAYTVTCSSL